MVVKNLTFQEQIELLKSRGIIVKNVEKSSKKIENISYYKLKEYATPFICAYIDGSPKYKGLEFDELLERYYQDKNLRIHLFHVIEKIEVSLKTRLAYDLGNMNAYGYLETDKWINKTERNAYRKYKKDFEYIFEKHSKFEKYELKTDVILGTISMKTPSVWVFVNSLNFSECVKIYKIMSNKRKKEIANYYGVTTKELISWLEALKLVRNLCAHNGKIIDLKLKSKPVLIDSWKEIYNEKSSSDLALIICILKNLVDVINSKYKWKYIRANILSLVGGSDDKARILGFNDKDSVYKLLGKRTCTKK